MNRLTRDETVEHVSRDQILRRERGQKNIHFLCSADKVQDWQPYPAVPCSCYMCDHTYNVVTTAEGRRGGLCSISTREMGPSQKRDQDKYFHRPTAMGQQKYKNETQKKLISAALFFFLYVPRYGLGK